MLGAWFQVISITKSKLSEFDRLIPGIGQLQMTIRNQNYRDRVDAGNLPDEITLLLSIAQFNCFSVCK